MKILVTIKRTPHRDTRMRVASDGRSLVTEGIKYEVNPFDEYAIEEALKIREARGGQVVVVCVGPAAADEQLLAALAMGADRSIRVATDADGKSGDVGRDLDSLQIAHALRAVVERESPELVLCGKLAIDDENGQVPPMLAALLDWPQASFASKIDLDDAGKTARVTCEVDGGLEVVEVDSPAVISADLRLNEPRYASVPGIMRAKKKPRDVIPLGDLGELPAGGARVVAHHPLPERPKGQTVKDADELADRLIAAKLV